MKMIMTHEGMISLENIRRVDKHCFITTHTSYGKKYEVSHLSIKLTYCDDYTSCINCGEDKTGLKLQETYLNEIYNILSKD